MFIRPPFRKSDTPPGPWSRICSYGEELPPGGDIYPGQLADYVLLETTAANAQIYAIATGELSMRAPGNGVPDPQTKYSPTYSTNVYRETVNVYIKSRPYLDLWPGFKERARGLNTLPGDSIRGFYYVNIDAESLKDDLGALLDAASIPSASTAVEREVNWIRFLRGEVDIHISGGHPIGKAGSPFVTLPNPSELQIGFTVLMWYGTHDPSDFYDWMREFVETQSDLDSLLGLIPKSWPIIAASISTDHAILMTEHLLYPFSALSRMRSDHDLSYEQWRKVGNNQKALYRKRLFRFATSQNIQAPPFEFNDRDTRNIFQLEALVEFYINFREPWSRSREPNNPNDETVNFLCLEGLEAQIGAAPNMLELDGDSDLSRIQIGHDTIDLEFDTSTRPSGRYRILHLDVATRTLTLDGTPRLVGSDASSPWKINRRPILVLVDSFASRLRGSKAVITGAKTVQLDGLPHPSKINPNFDTIYFDEDTGATFIPRTYRILKLEEDTSTITLDLIPHFSGPSSGWRIPAGIGAEAPPFDDTGDSYHLGPAQLGYDHFDGCMFVIHDDMVKGKYRWTSYTSRKPWVIDPVGSLSSIRGNSIYEYKSYRSGTAFKNYCFKITDPGDGRDIVHEARFYFSDQVTSDTNGKTEIRIHFANKDDTGSGSAGCLVSRQFYQMRACLIKLHQEKLRGMGQLEDAEINKLLLHPPSLSAKDHHDHSKKVWAPPTKLSDPNWTDKLQGECWLIRPDERPFG